MDAEEKHFYQIDLKQGDLLIELISDDISFIGVQMQRWCEVYIDNSYQPIKIPLGLPGVTPSHTTARPTPSVAVEEKGEESPPEKLVDVQNPNEALMQHVLHLEQQVELLTKQAMQAQQQVTVQKPQRPEDPTAVEAFVAPAHNDVTSSFDNFQSTLPESQSAPLTFEQPVNNPAISVQNKPEKNHREILETIVLPDSQVEVKESKQSVKNSDFSTNETTQAKAEPPTLQPSNPEDLDLLLDSLASDLEEETEIKVESPPITADIPQKAPKASNEAPPLPSRPGNKVEAAPLSSKTEAVTNDLDDFEKDLQASLLAENMPPQKAPVAGAQPYPPPIESTAQEEIVSQPVEKSPQEETAEPEEVTSPKEESTTQPGLTLPEEEHERPDVKYDFGIPPPPPSTDPEIKKLSLEAIENISLSPADLDSPFPEGSDGDEDVPQKKVTEAYSSKHLESGPPPELQQMPDSELSEIEDMQIESFQEFCDLAPKAKEGPDYLILAAYFLTQFKQVEKYALKDLNTQLVRSGLTPINHAILESAVEKGLLSLVPDMTGAANAAEYTITADGQSHAKSFIQY